MSAATASADAPPSQQLTTNSASISLTGKRKRQDPAVNATDETHASRGESIHDVLSDLLDVLESAYPLTSTILTRSIQSSHPSTKRTKRPTTTAADSVTTSIKSQVESKAYNSFEELVEDLDKAVDDVIAEMDISAGQNGVTSVPSIQDARSFQAEVRKLLATSTPSASRKPLTEVSGNLEKDIKSKLPPQGRSVLTLFGHSGHGQPRQYFASLKDVAGESDPAGVDPMAMALLPNGIFTTSVLPSKGTASSKPKPKRTLKDVLPAPPSSHPYKPPAAPPSRATRSSVVEWYRPSAEPPRTRPGDKEVYAEQQLTLGQWLSYLSHTDTDETVSEKRLKRDRALSGGEGPDESELEFLQQQRNSRARAQKSSLFRSAFSSFAPSRDDSNAVVPAEIRSHLWWNKIGKEVYDSYTAPPADILIDPELEQSNTSPADDIRDAQQESRDFQEAVDAYASIDHSVDDDAKQRKDEEEILDEITDSIEALLVYQQERHKVIPANGRTGASQQPSAAEQAIYETMKAQLMLILSQLPPHVVTRLNGDKLGKLNISTTIPITAPSYSGVIEEPERPSVAPPASSQTRPVSVAHQSSANRVMYQQAANTPPARPAAQPPRSAAATTSQYGSRTQSGAQYGYQSQTVQQPPRTYQYQQQQQQQSQSSQMPNGYRQQLQTGYQQYGQYAGQGAGSPAARPPHANQYSNRQQQGYQPRPGTYQPGPAQMTPPAAGRSASPQNPSSYSAVQNRSAYGHGQSQGQHTNGQNGQYAAGLGRPSSGSNAGAASGSFAMAGVKFSDEELAAIQRRQMQNSPPLPQTPVGQRPPSANGITLNAQAPQAPMQANGA